MRPDWRLLFPAEAVEYRQKMAFQPTIGKFHPLKRPASPSTSTSSSKRGIMTVRPKGRQIRHEQTVVSPCGSAQQALRGIAAETVRHQPFSGEKALGSRTAPEDRQHHRIGHCRHRDSSSCRLAIAGVLPVSLDVIVQSGVQEGHPRYFQPVSVNSSMTPGPP